MKSFDLRWAYPCPSLTQSVYEDKNDDAKVFQDIGSTWNKVFQKFSTNETLCFKGRNKVFRPQKHFVSSIDTVIGLPEWTAWLSESNLPQQQMITSHPLSMTWQEEKSQCQQREFISKKEGDTLSNCRIAFSPIYLNESVRSLISICGAMRS